MSFLYQEGRPGQVVQCTGNCTFSNYLQGEVQRLTAQLQQKEKDVQRHQELLLKQPHAKQEKRSDTLGELISSPCF